MFDQMQQQQQAGTKLEKAELLEMTVAYVCRVQRDVSQQMSRGFASCMREVDAFLARGGTGSEVDTELRAHLVRRLSRCRRHLGSAVCPDQIGSRRCDQDRPSSSSTSTSGSSLLPRKLCFDDAEQAQRSALRDINDSARYTQLTSGDLYRRPATLTTGTENTDSLYGQLDMATVGVDSISSTTATSAQQGRTVEYNERCLSSHDVSAFDLTTKRSAVHVNDEPFTPVWRPW